jgi:hypothetical protein
MRSCQWAIRDVGACVPRGRAAGIIVLHDGDLDMLCLLQERQGLAHGARGLRAGVPGDQHPFERGRVASCPRQHHDGAGRIHRHVFGNGHVARFVRAGWFALTDDDQVRIHRLSRESVAWVVVADAVLEGSDAGLPHLVVELSGAQAGVQPQLLEQRRQRAQVDARQCRIAEETIDACLGDADQVSLLRAREPGGEADAVGHPARRVYVDENCAVVHGISIGRNVMIYLSSNRLCYAVSLRGPYLFDMHQNCRL